MTSPAHAVLLRYGLGAVAVAALAGCGARSNAVASPRPGTAVSVTGLTDPRIAGAAQLRLSDFPAGWTSTPRPPATIGLKCPGIRGALAAVSAHRASPAFRQGTAITADSAAYIYADPVTAGRWFTRLSGRDTRTCLVRAIRASVEMQIRPQGAKLDSVTARRLTTAQVGDQRAADRIVVRLRAGSSTGKAEIDLIFVRVGRGLAAFSLSAAPGPFDHALETGLVRTVTERLSAGLNGAS